MTYPLLTKAEASRPQYYIGFGSCNSTMQNQAFGNWVMYHRRSVQLSGSLTLHLDTRNKSHVADASGTVVPRDFPITNLYIAYFDNRAVMKLDDALATQGYTQMTSWYRVHVNGQRVTTVQDMKEKLSGDPTATYAMFNLKVTVKGAIEPSTSQYVITITKNCANAAACAAIPDPADVFVSGQGHVAYSLWSVQQPLTINGVYKRDHAWCPVQSAINTD
ncbi:hypothetical protein PLESTF_001836200 [Pleodorina starrii]|nr:hypothetical protein PLESTF_001836200 [Pleodorina starrii]